MSNNQITSHRQNHLKFGAWKLGFIWILGSVIWNLNTSPVFAQINISNLTYPGQKITPGSLSNLLTGAGFNLISFIFFLAGAIFLISLLQAAWGYVNSSGDQKKIAESTSRLLNSFYGIVIVLASFVVIRLILAVLGISDILKIS